MGLQAGASNERHRTDAEQSVRRSGGGLLYAGAARMASTLAADREGKGVSGGVAQLGVARPLTVSADGGLQGARVSLGRDHPDTAPSSRLLFVICTNPVYRRPVHRGRPQIPHCPRPGTTLSCLI
jgi:hypothetical protein